MIFIIFLIVIIGCACPNEKRYYIPDILKTKPVFYPIPTFESVDKINVINAQSKKKDKLGHYRHYWDADLNKWTDCAVSLVSDFLKQRGAKITTGSNKRLALSVTNVDVSWGFSQITCSMNLDMELGNGYWKSFHSTYTSRDLYDSCNGALISAVSSMFFDNNFLAYVSKEKREEKSAKCIPTQRDSDCDGVPDDIDKCPFTPPCVKVDRYGCPLDTDKDKIPDYLDRCPNSPIGAEVDQYGCWKLKNILFDFDKYEIKPEYKIYLDRIAEILRKNPDVKMKIHGHADIIGGERYNLKLSEKRAKEVLNYLVKKGIRKDRFTAKGFGYWRPIAPSDTEAGRALNRRVELIPSKR